MKKTPDLPEGKPSAAAKHAHFSPSADLFTDSLAPERAARDQGPNTRPVVTGQCAQVLELIRLHGPVLSFVLTADHAIPETAARVHDLRVKGFNVVTTILPAVEFRGVIRRNAALYSMGIPEWGAPRSSQAGAIDAALAGLIAFGAVCAVLMLGVL